jgi:hypothetical protein
VSALKWLAGLAAAGVGLVWYRSASAQPADDLRYGDDAYVRVGGPNGINPQDAGLGSIPVAVSQVVLSVTGLADQWVQGTITAYNPTGTPQVVTLQQPIGPLQVPRNTVKSVVRGGVVVRTSNT